MLISLSHSILSPSRLINQSEISYLTCKLHYLVPYCKLRTRFLSCASSRLDHKSTVKSWCVNCSTDRDEEVAG